MATSPRPRTPRSTPPLLAERWWDRLAAVGAIGSATAAAVWVAETRGPAEVVGGACLAAASVALLSQLRTQPAPPAPRSHPTYLRPEHRYAVASPPVLSPRGLPDRGPLPTGPAAAVPSFSRSDSGWWPVTTTLSHPGDRLWSEWSGHAGPGFPVSVIGPVPETAWVRPSDGAFLPFPEREPDLVIDPPAVEVGPGLPAGPAAGLSPLVIEAMSPVPVYERIPAPSPRAAPPGRPRPPVGAACASCNDWVVDLRKWSPCPDCLRPVCTECLLESMAVAGHGTCATCIVDPRGAPTAS